MDSKLLLVKCVTLLYRESCLTVRSENSADLVRTVIEEVKVSDITSTVNKERDVILALKQTVLEMCENPLDYEYEKSVLLHTLKMNCIDDETLYENIEQSLDSDMNESSLKRTVGNIRKGIHNHFREAKVNDILGKASYAFRHSRDKIKNVQTWVADLCSQLEPFQMQVGGKDPAVIEDVDTQNLEKSTEVFNSIKEAASGESIMKTGWQGVNRMLNGGFRRGEEVVVGALQHKWKTGFSLSLFKHLAIYNKPQMKDITKKPLLLRISFEDPLKLNFQFLYQSFKEDETGKKVSIKNVDPTEMAEYVKLKLAVNGYHTRFMYVNPSMWSYKDICNKIIELEAEGFEIHCCMVDYLLKLPTTGCDVGPMGHDIRNMYERICNFMKARDILFITPHQLSPAAKMRIREGATNFVKDLPGLGLYSGSSQIDQVVDLELYIHIETLNKESYLTIQRGKHRIIEQTPLVDQYCVLKFSDVGIPDDFGKSDSTRLKVGGGVIGSGEETPFWEFG